MHDDDNLRPHFSKVTLRHMTEPVTLRELLHSTLDRLLDEMIQETEPRGCVAVTNMDPSGPENPLSGHTVVLALDLDPESGEYEDLDEGLRDN